MTPGSSAFIIARDPFRSVRWGRQIFQRKFTRGQGFGPLRGDGLGNLEVDLAIGAGLADSCAAPHLFGLGRKELLADEMTTDLRAIRQFNHSTAS